MLFITIFLGCITIGGFIWTIIQAFKPEWFYKAEYEANVKRQRPWWYLMLGIIGLVALVIFWIQAITLKLTSVWILTIIYTLGSVKGFGMVFFYNKFSGGVSKYMDKLQSSKKAYAKLVASRALLTVATLLATMYFVGIFGPVR